MHNITKRYTNGEVTVIWQPHLCEHSTKCFKGLPQVFDPRVRPWVKAEGASTEHIVRQVQECPSGALSYAMNTQEQQPLLPTIPTEQPMEQTTTQTTEPASQQTTAVEQTIEQASEQAPLPTFTVEVVKGGPLRLRGPFVIQHRDGRTETKERASFCRCGQSKIKPFCDGTHKSIGWDQGE